MTEGSAHSKLCRKGIGLAIKPAFAQGEIDDAAALVVHPAPDDAHGHRHQRVGQEHDRAVDGGTLEIAVDEQRDAERQRDGKRRGADEDQRIA